MPVYGRVSKVEQLGPTYVRITLGGEGLEGFEPSEATDAYINAAFPPSGAPYAAPFDLDELKSLPNEQRPFRRRYTVRDWEPGAGELVLEFSVHDVTGAGGRWASEAKVGDALVFTGPAGSYAPDPAADWHLLVGDESALPAICATLSAIPAGAPVVVRLLVDGPEDELELETPGALDLEWIHRGAGVDPSLLADSVRDTRAARGPLPGLRPRRGRGDARGPPAPPRAAPGHPRRPLLLPLLEARPDR